MLASSDKATARKSIGKAIGSPWKFPAEITRSSSTKTVGLSVTLLISVSNTFPT
jgi:hypothetical protein